MFRKRKPEPAPRPECWKLPSGYANHQGPMTRWGCVGGAGKPIYDRYVCKQCGSELFAANADSAALDAGMPVEALLARVHAHEPAVAYGAFNVGLPVDQDPFLKADAT